MSSEEFAHRRPPFDGVRRFVRPRGRFRIAACYIVLMVVALAVYDTPEAARRRRLVAIHRHGAAECRRQARTLRAAGKVDEAQALARSARNHDWFADAYRGVIRRPVQ